MRTDAWYRGYGVACRYHTTTGDVYILNFPPTSNSAVTDFREAWNYYMEGVVRAQKAEAPAAEA